MTCGEEEEEEAHHISSSALFLHLYTSLCSGLFPPAFVGLNQLKIDPTVISGLFGLMATVAVRFYPRLHNT